MSDRHVRLKMHFLAARELSGDARDAYLDDACDDESLRREVRALLDAESDDVAVLDSHPGVLAAAFEPEADPQAIGPYRILERLGEGGMGIVYVAQQTTPVERRVALKVIRLGMDTTEVVARFENERQTLAVMDHPGIARVFDAGITERGRPYFVMELVKGVPITAYCDRHTLPLRERLALFVETCRAVQHAHTKGIIHRDLKPSNVLVTIVDDAPMPKVIDFGVAKATAPKPGGSTVFTEHGRILGTPEYMSPEQADGGYDIDTRTDVYALGVMMYELLTDALPFDSSTLRSGGLADISRVLREVEPSRPSARANTRELRGDLDWIVMKAIEKDRTRRYDSAGDLARDVERFLHDEPVLAGPPSAAYRIRKFVRRHRLGASAAALVSLGLIVGFAGIVIGLVRALDAEADAVDAQQATEAALAEVQLQVETVRAINAFLNDDLLAYADPYNTPDPDMSMRDVLGAAADRIDGRFDDSPVVEAALRNTLGVTYVNLAMYDEAAPFLDGAYTIRKRELGDDHPATLETRQALASLAYYRGELGEAETLFGRVLDDMRRVLGEDDPLTLETTNALAFAKLQRGGVEEAETLFAGAIAALEERGDRPEELYTTMSNLALLLHRTNRHDEAQASYERALEGLREHLGAEHPTSMTCLCNLASLHNDRRAFAEAEPLLDEAIALQEGVLGPAHRSTLMTKNNLAFLYSMRGDIEDAERLHDAILAARRETLGDEHPHTMLSLVNLADIYRRSERPAEAESALDEALAISRRVYGDEHYETLLTIRDLASLLLRHERAEDAEPLYAELAETASRVLGKEHALAVEGVRGLEETRGATTSSTTP